MKTKMRLVAKVHNKMKRILSKYVPYNTKYKPLGVKPLMSNMGIQLNIWNFDLRTYRPLVLRCNFWMIVQNLVSLQCHSKSLVILSSP